MDENTQQMANQIVIPPFYVQLMSSPSSNDDKPAHTHDICKKRKMNIRSHKRTTRKCEKSEKQFTIKGNMECFVKITRSNITRQTLLPSDKDEVEEETQTEITERYKCEICKIEFAHEMSLRRHYLAKHPRAKPYKCETCGIKIKYKNNLKKHSQLHTGVKPYKCEKCHKEFAEKSNLTQHLKIHAGIKPFKCEICKKRFIENRDLIQHASVHTAIKPFKCEICGNQFKWKRNLKAHEKWFHP